MRTLEHDRWLRLQLEEITTMAYGQNSEQVRVVKNKVEHTGTLDEIITLLNAIKNSTVFTGEDCKVVLLGRMLVDKERKASYDSYDADDDR